MNSDFKSPSLTTPQISTAFILVGGANSKLPKQLSEVPGALVPVSDRAFLDLLLKKLKDEGFRQVVLLAGEQGDLFRMYAERSEEFGLEIMVSVELTPLGTAGALAFAVDQMKSRGMALPPAFLLIKGDRWPTGSLEPLKKAKVSAEPPLALVQVDGQSTDDILLLHPSILELIPRKKFCNFKKEVLSRFPQVQSIPLEGRLFDLGEPSGYAELCMDQGFSRMQKEAPWTIPLLASWINHGTIVTTNEDDFTALIQCGLENVTLGPELDGKTVRGLTDRDVCIDRFASDELLAEIAANTSASVIRLVEGKANTPLAGLCDGVVAVSEWNQGLLRLNDVILDLHDIRWYYNKRPTHSSPCLFLDRDGTIIEHVHYLSKPEDVHLRHKMVSLIKAAHERQWGVICVTNQSGLGRSHFSWDDYMRVQKRMNELLAEQGVFLDASLEAPYFRDSQSARWQRSPALRKPRGGLLHMAARRWGYDIRKSVMIGDSLVDLQAGAVAGVRRVVWVGNDKKVLSEYENWAAKWPGNKPELFCDPHLQDFNKILSF